MDGYSTNGLLFVILNLFYCIYTKALLRRGTDKGKTCIILTDKN